MIKWVTNWTQAKSYQDTIRKDYGVIWAVKMPQTYPECRATRQGIAHIAITNDEIMVEALRQDGGEVQLLP